jgi:hypothetical protein
MKNGFALAIALFGISACADSPTEPENQRNQYTMTAAMDNASGAPTLLDTRLLLDGVIVDQNIGNPAGSEARFIAADTILSGSHVLRFQLDSQTTTAPTSYRVPGFDLILFPCGGGAFDDDGGFFGRTYSFKSQTVDLVAGQAIEFQFRTPGCSYPADVRIFGNSFARR